jgi:nucleoprotein TPR
MKTRRKSRAVAEADQDGSQLAEDNTSHNIEIPDDIDLESLQNILPDTSLTSPSPDSIVSLYRLLLAQVEEADATQRELEEARAEAEKKDVELDQALQDRESQTKDLETSLDIVQSELKEMKQERDQLGTLQHLVFRALLMLYSFYESRITSSNQYLINFSIFYLD